MVDEKYDFSGWATKNDFLCADGRVIRRDAFKECDGKTVPLVWAHMHDDPGNVLGHALLINKPEGVYTYGKFNETPSGTLAKTLVESGDITGLSIYANQLQQKKTSSGKEVMHGVIREVSLVLSGANPGAFIDFPVLSHSGETDESEAVIYSGDDILMEQNELIRHSDESKEAEEETVQHSDDDIDTAKGEKEMADNKEKTIGEIFDSFTEEQKQVLYYMVGKAMEDKGDDEAEHSDEEGETFMKHNVFDTDERYEENTLSHSDMEVIIKDGKRYGSLKDSVLAHAEDYGIDGIEWLFPEDRELNRTPEFIKRDDDWVSVVMGGIHHTPFSRVKSTFANITEDEARAKGYIKGKLKKEEVFSLLKRATTPQTIYKKQKLDRDDIIDITDFDVVAWLKGEMRMMLNEEIARAVLVGDGRLASDDDKISEDHVRPIANDADLFTIKKVVTVASGASDETKAKEFIKQAIKARKDYKGSGNPVLFTTEDLLTDMLLIEDQIGRTIYETESALATKLRVSKIVTVPVLENAKVGDSPLMGIIVNLKDYNVGADKGGAINMFDDFDIDYNQEKYLIETRISGALTVPYSAIVLFDGSAPTSVDGGVQKSKTVKEDNGD